MAEQALSLIEKFCNRTSSVRALFSACLIYYASIHFSGFSLCLPYRCSLEWTHSSHSLRSLYSLFPVYPPSGFLSFLLNMCTFFLLEIQKVFFFCKLIATFRELWPYLSVDTLSLFAITVFHVIEFGLFMIEYRLRSNFYHTFLMFDLFQTIKYFKEMP